MKLFKLYNSSLSLALFLFLSLPLSVSPPPPTLPPRPLSPLAPPPFPPRRRQTERLRWVSISLGLSLRRLTERAKGGVGGRQRERGGGYAGDLKPNIY